MTMTRRTRRPATPPTREGRIRWLEEHQRDLEQRAADVAERIRRLREAPISVANPAGPVGGAWRAGDWRDRARRRNEAAQSFARASGAFDFSGAPARAARPATSPGAKDVEVQGRGRLSVHQLDGPPGAPTLVLLHGLGGTAAGNWAPSIPALLREFHIVAPDLRGHGPASADDVAALIEALGVEQAILVGYSMGSGVAYQVWARHPERVQGLVVCAAAGVPTERPLGEGQAPDVPSAIVVTLQDRLIPAAVQQARTASLPGATVHHVAGGHFVFARRDVFVPVLMDACRSVASRAQGSELGG